jgi:peptidoglycan/xylan/chitin deacetylase (PgdA/CDA1 family)
MTFDVNCPSTRRNWLRQAGVLAASLMAPRLLRADPSKKARIAITLDLEMSAEYPKRGMTEWNFEKGNLDEPTKQYAVDAARLVKDYGGVIHFFCVGRVLEQPDVSWLKEIIEAGHPVGNHTYDHVYVLAKAPEETQFRFRRSPWLVEGQTVEQIIRTNIRLTTEAMKARLRTAPNGFRTPGGFADGLIDHIDVQKLLREEGFKWVSSRYPAHDSGQPDVQPDESVFRSIVEAQARAQPFVYPAGLIEIPMSPISDVNAFRTNHWKREWFLEAIRRAVGWTIENQAVFDFLAHPSCLVVEDPEFESIRLICELTKAAGDRAEIVSLDQIAT